MQEQETPASEGKTVKITLNVGGNNNGSRVNVNPPHVAFEQYDEIVVASNGKYVGTLTHNGNVFEGEITGATENQPLYFYFLGNKDLQYTMDGDNIVGCTLNISDQSAELPVLSYAASNEVYTTSTTSFTAALDNQCALVKFTYSAGHDLRLREVASFRRAGASHHLWTFVAYSWTFVFFNMNYHVIGHELFNNYLFVEIRVCNTNKRIFFGRGSRPCGLHPCLISAVTP